MYINTVDNADKVIGSIDRHDALTAGVNFRVVHVFLFDASGSLLLQQIPNGKRHGGYWGSSVAGYVEFNEDYDAAASRRVFQEMGCSIALRFIGKSEMLDGKAKKFIALYKALLTSSISPNPAEIAAVEFVQPNQIAAEIQSGRRLYTPTFRHIFQQMPWQR